MSKPRKPRNALALTGAKPESKSKQIARTFAFHVRARRLPEPRWFAHPEGELRFAGEQTDIQRQDQTKKRGQAPGWRFDFAWPEHRIAVEIEGLVVFRGSDGHMQTGGRHVNIGGFKDDCEKYAWAAVLGWRVLRFEQSQVASGFAIDMLVRMFAAVEDPMRVEVPRIVFDCDPPPFGVVPALSLHDEAEDLFRKQLGEDR